jgi:hypothetical protein
MAAFRLDHEKMAGRVMDEGPADRLAVLFRDQEGAMMFGAAMLQLAPVIGGKSGIAAAVGLESGFIVLQPGDEGQDRRFVGRQMCLADINGRAP